MMGDVINMKAREAVKAARALGEGLTVKVRLHGVKKMTARMYLGAFIIAFGAAVMGIKVNVE